MCGAVIFRKFFLEKVRLIQINASPVGIANRRKCPMKMSSNPATALL